MHVHPVLLLGLLFWVVVLVGGFFVAGWALRKGWDAAAPRMGRRPLEKPQGSDGQGSTNDA